MPDYSIRDVLTNISLGNLRVPSFQRGFVWESDSVAFLMDSIYKQYPFGTIQLWRTKEELESEREFGPFKLFDRDKEYPIDYILDGQQRITSIFGVFQTEIENTLSKENPFNIYFDFLASADKQDSQFVAFPNKDAANLDQYFPLNCLFDTVKYRNATKHLSEEHVTKIDHLQETFKEVRIPFQRLETNEKSKVAIVFERINRRGVPLDTLQLLTAWTWSEDFDLKDKFNELAEDLSPFGFSNLAENNDLLLKIASAILTKDVRAESLITLNGSEVKLRFDEITNGIKGAIDFLQRELYIEQLTNLPYEAIIIPLSVFFSNKGNQHFNLIDENRKILIKWFWRVCFSKKYSSGTTNNLNSDITSMVQLKEQSINTLTHMPAPIINSNFFQNNNFSFGAVNSKSFILLLISKGPKNLISGTNINLAQTLKEYNRKEFHHLYPKASFEGDPAYSINCLANFCILARADNKKIDCKLPSVYRSTIMPKDSTNIFEANFIDEQIFVADDFKRFIDSRTKLLHQYLNTLIQ